MSKFRAGDVVKHIPSGETWELAYATNTHVSWNGWPEGTASVNDCELVRECNDERHRAVLESWAAKYGNDHRIHEARRQLFELNQGFVGAGI